MPELGDSRPGAPGDLRITARDPTSRPLAARSRSSPASWRQICQIVGGCRSVPARASSSSTGKGAPRHPLNG
jgi:hypothetical protein